MKKNKIIKLLSAAVIIALLMLLPVSHASAKSDPIDEILDYTITVDVNEDATLNIVYNITWKVLDSDSEGPLEWVQIGLPNKHYSNVMGLSENISHIKMTGSKGTFAEIHFNEKYYKDDIAWFAFSVTMDNMYSAYPDEGYVSYTFAPGWFDDIDVDNLTVRWNNDKIMKWSPDCKVEEGYNVWNTSLPAGKTFIVHADYPTDAYKFDLKKKITNNGYDPSDYNILENIFSAITAFIGVLIILTFIAMPVALPILRAVLAFKQGRGFNRATEKKVTRTIIEYYPSCPNCGAGREEGKDTCAYCGSNLVKSKQEIKEEDIPKVDKNILSYKTDGEYKYSDNPNKYVRVNVIPVQIAAQSAARSILRSSFSSSGRGSGSHHSCAHSSCACACACACAGGGRAGCTTKDFYNTDLKLKYLENRKK